MAFPKSEQSTAYSAFVQAIESDPVVARECKTRQYWTGQQILPPAVDLCPFLRLTPKSTPDQDWIDSCDIRQDLDVEVMVVMSGQDVTVMMDAWQALMRALYPKDQAKQDAVWDRLSKAGLNDIHFLQGPVEVQEHGGGLVMVGKGNIHLEITTALKSL